MVTSTDRGVLVGDRFWRYLVRKSVLFSYIQATDERRVSPVSGRQPLLTECQCPLGFFRPSEYVTDGVGEGLLELVARQNRLQDSRRGGITSVDVESVNPVL
ncbi:hypothetical protein [Halorientalis regularis]|uniref:hypothetical protein n=1 Tax=Halorientalis regularis TaxID=660518 RepID=UPI002032DF0F|nr:hypothetical protein [Halorientalis regularis]